jgi:hypothetical protein
VAQTAVQEAHTMNEPLGDTGRRPSRGTIRPLRPCAQVLESVTLVLGGRHLGTFTLNAPYAGEPLRLYVLQQPNGGERSWSRTVDCLITDAELG